MQKREVFTPARADDTLCLQERIIILLQHDNDFEIGSTFKSKDRESREMTCGRTAQSLDDHFDEYSPTPAYSELEVIGVTLGEMHLKPLIEVGFNQFLLTESGFLAEKQGKPA
ncbi:MAG: hypothetical protein LBI35_07640 [Burkholderiales bacterium]|jgi:hypothetical protein|nr:hypothetical protein [Burkholderiales bacterium]